MKLYLGVDPGKSGAMALLTGEGEVVAVHKLSGTQGDTVAWLSRHCVTLAYLEKVSARPKQGIASTCKFCRIHGFLQGVLMALFIPFEEVTPGVWQRSMGCLSKGDKNVTKAKAQQLFPGERVTHATADALLIAEYGRRLNERTV